MVGYTAVLQSTNSSEIDGYSLTETSYEVAYYYDAGVIGYLFDGSSMVDAKAGEGTGAAEAYPTTTSVHQGDTYTLYSEHYLIAYYYTPGVGFYNPYDYYPGTGFAPGDPGYAPGSSFSSGGGPGVVQESDIYLGYTYLQFSPVQPQVSAISPQGVVRGTSDSFNLQGSHLQDDFGVFTVRALDGDNISVASSDQTTASLSYTIAADATVGTHRFTVSNTWGESEPVSFTVNAATGFNAQQNACPAMVDATSGFSSIAPSGLAVGGSGSMTVSFSQGSFSGFGITVPYGPNSTPESIASHLAALITKQYSSSGLTAQAYGANILYKGNAALGTATFTPAGPSGSSSDSSFTADPSPAGCPPVNLTFALIVTYDSGTWVPNSRGGPGSGRDVSYELSKWTKGNYNANKPPLISSQISEHLSKPLPDGSYGKTDTQDPGAYCDLIGSAGGPSLTGIYDPERYFTVVYTDPQHLTRDLGSVRILDKSGEHSTDKIVVNFPSGPTILNGFDQNHLLSYLQTLRLVKGPCGH